MRVLLRRANRAAAGVCAVALLSATSGLLYPITAQSTPITFTRDIAPIVFEHCVSCHQPGGSAPMSLVTYEDVSAWADRIVTVTANRYMPPWKPEPGYGEFADTRRLTDAQIAAIQRWVADGHMRGDPAAMPRLPGPSTGWQLGTPDLVITMDRPLRRACHRRRRVPSFRHSDSGRQKKFVRAWELRADNSPALHHATMEIDRTGMSRHLDMEDPAPGYEGLIAPHDDGSRRILPRLGAWPHAVSCSRWHGVSDRAEQRPGADAAPSAERKGAAGPGQGSRSISRHSADASAGRAAAHASRIWISLPVNHATS
jgi:mono/diheme cytochrome c family protein